MKRILFFIGILLTYSNLIAQENITKTYHTSNNYQVNINLKFAKMITLKSWNKNKILIEAKVNINQNKDNNYFSLKKKVGKNALNITSDYGVLFKKQQKGVTITHNGDSCYNHSTQHNEVVVNYIIYAPKNIDLKIKSISGSVTSSEYKGNLTLNLISGDITIKKFSKKMNLKTISGDIDLSVSDVEFKAKTVTGTVYSNLNIDFNNKKPSTNIIKGKIGKGTTSLVLNTISGNILLRK